MFHPTTYTVESVTSGHPDKICDQISDAILDACLTQDPQSRVAIETLGAHGLLVIGGELTTSANINVPSIARKLYKHIGYTDKLQIITRIVRQSPDIAQGVDTGGAGDQGIMYGYATDETPQYLPLGVVLVHQLASGLEQLRTSQKLPWLLPDGKTQVTISNGKVQTILISCQHTESITQPQIHEALTTNLINPIITNFNNTPLTILTNPTCQFTLGGFTADTGLTGRKIMVDTYGGLIPHGGGCFSGKDPTKVDRSAAYMARFAAKNIVAAGHAHKCLVTVAYAIGLTQPLMLTAINERGQDISQHLKDFDFRPQSIIDQLNLLQPIYSQTSTYGHFGKSQLPWEKITD